MPLTICVTCRSTTTLDSASACVRSSDKLTLHQVEHRRHRVLGREIEILVEAERDPRVHDARDRRAQLEIAELERHLCPLERRLDRGARDLAVALRGMTVTRREHRAVERDRQVQRRAGDEQLAVDVAAPLPRRPGRVDAGLRWRHADHAHERRERHGLAAVVGRGIAVDRPVERRAVRERDAPVSRRHLVDRDDERLPGRAPRTSIGPVSA